MNATEMPIEELEERLKRAKPESFIHASNLAVALHVAIRSSPDCTRREAWIQNLKQLQQGGQLDVNYPG